MNPICELPLPSHSGLWKLIQVNLRGKLHGCNSVMAQQSLRRSTLLEEFSQQNTATRLRNA
jgi:hypothetical protein